MNDQFRAYAPPVAERMAWFCTCGAAWTGRTYDPLLMRREWEHYHSGPGHAPTTARKAAAIRRKHEKGLER